MTATRYPDWRSRRPPGVAKADAVLSRSDASLAARAVWMRLIAFAGAATSETPVSALPDFRHDLALVSNRLFPVEGESAQGAGRGFIEFARAWSVAATFERREMLTPPLKAAAKALDDLMHEDRARAHQSTWYGRRDAEGDD